MCSHQVPDNASTSVGQPFVMVINVNLGTPNNYAMQQSYVNVSYPGLPTSATSDGTTMFAPPASLTVTIIPTSADLYQKVLRLPAVPFLFTHRLLQRYAMGDRRDLI